ESFNSNHRRLAAPRAHRLFKDWAERPVSLGRCHCEAQRALPSQLGQSRANNENSRQGIAPTEPTKAKRNWAENSAHANNGRRQLRAAGVVRLASRARSVLDSNDRTR